MLESMRLALLLGNALDDAISRGKAYLGAGATTVDYQML